MAKINDPTKITGLTNALRTAQVVRQANTLADTRRQIEAVRLPQNNALADALKQIDAVKIPQNNALADALKQLEGVTLPQSNALADALRRFESLKLPQNNALADALKQIEGIRLPQDNALADALKQIDAVKLPQNNALADAMKQIESVRAPQNALAESLIKKLEGVKVQSLTDGDSRSTPKATTKEFDETPSSQRSQTTDSFRRAIKSTLALGHVVRARRIDLELTQQELADAAGTGRRFISELETGKPTAELGKVIQVFQCLGLDIIVTSR